MLQLTGVTTGYGQSTVVHEANLHVPSGQCVALMGHNGAGKTTLLRAAVGLLPTSGGSITLGGTEVTGRRPNERVARGLGYVPQGQVSFPDMTTLENLQVVGADQSAIDEVVEIFPALTPLMNRRAGLLSGGQRQQLAIARTLLTRPKLLILDEPTEGIQPNVVEQIEQVIANLVTTGDLSVLIVEQHIGFALRIADEYAVIESGRIVGSGPADEGAAAQVRELMAV